MARANHLLPEEFVSSINRLHKKYGNDFLGFVCFFGDRWFYIAIVFSYSIIYGMFTTVTAVMLVVERKKGLVERATVAGVNFSEAIIAIIILWFFIMMIEITCILIIDIYKGR